MGDASVAFIIPDAAAIRFVGGTMWLRMLCEQRSFGVRGDP
jgi:hypothetical protein